ncbi:MAG TPA: tRNA pseudouridine(55) synthase TruB [Dehalococcoidia bacterium]|nr:tRNA pseudouridine(55) synthase TruB [Chloroflexota bacterium]MDP7090211.1 tRNA pseudouridine(55) synthase TruB [Dehalococcoidia bacterium]HJP27278.1 tRNA pseudouridine(55) synthase TruB [Dehalococcoidia bacterium]
MTGKPGISEGVVRAEFGAGGYLNINKPEGWASTDVVRKLKGITQSKKIGHGGTLDPLATGVLPICVDAATRFADTVLLGTKSYRITMKLGSSTNTYDSTGETMAESDWSGVTQEKVVESLEQFTGKFDQVPPMFSALHHNGQRLYELARRGIEVERPARPVEVLNLELVEFVAPDLVLDVECGHGFYARTLAHDIGEKLGTHAHLTALVRTHAGAFRLEDSVTIEQVSEAAELGDWRTVAMPIDTTLQHIAKTTLTAEFVEMVKHGRQLAVGDIGKPGEYQSGDRIRAYTPEDELLAILIFEPEKLGWRPEKVLAVI